VTDKAKGLRLRIHRGRGFVGWGRPNWLATVIAGHMLKEQIDVCPVSELEEAETLRRKAEADAQLCRTEAARQQRRADQAEQQAASMREGLERFVCAAQRLDLKTLLSIGLAPDDLDAAFRVLSRLPTDVEERTLGVGAGSPGDPPSERGDSSPSRLSASVDPRSSVKDAFARCLSLASTKEQELAALALLDAVKAAPQQHVEQPERCGGSLQQGGGEDV
jgi:hypothetical protein